MCLFSLKDDFCLKLLTGLPSKIARLLVLNLFFIFNFGTTDSGVLLSIMYKSTLLTQQAEARAPVFTHNITTRTVVLP